MPYAPSDPQADFRVTYHGTNSGPFMGMPPTGKQTTTTGIDITRLANGKKRLCSVCSSPSQNGPVIGQGRLNRRASLCSGLRVHRHQF